MTNSNSRFYTYLDGNQLQPWYQIEIVTIPETNTKVVYFNSRIHVNKRVALNPSFSSEFTDYEILRNRDLLTGIYNKYGVDIFSQQH